MNDCVMTVDNLGKRYRISTSREQPETLRELLVATVRSPFSYLREMTRPPTEAETLWALRGVSFDVRRGEVVGLIGRNGAGKSTLLKILSRVTDPSEGRAVLRGRVGSLLEVGTGFHPELTGRENIYLSGTILGMKRSEIDRRFDEIVDFSGVEKFIETPVKRYSSGMNVRLGFAVAAHLEPEILIVDEVLAVGDAAFQRKCLGKIEGLASSGRTVLFVTHSMAALQAFCQRVLLMESGAIVRSGTPEEVIGSYLDRSNAIMATQIDLAQHPNRTTPPDQIVLESLRILGSHGRARSTFQMGETITFEVTLDVGRRVLQDPIIVIAIERRALEVCNLSTRYMTNVPFALSGRVVARCEWSLGDLGPGLFSVADVMVKEHTGAPRLDAIEDVGNFEVTPRDVYGTGNLPHETKLLVPEGHWSFMAHAEAAVAELPAS